MTNGKVLKPEEFSEARKNAEIEKKADKEAKKAQEKAPVKVRAKSSTPKGDKGDKKLTLEKLIREGKTLPDILKELKGKVSGAYVRKTWKRIKG